MQTIRVQKLALRIPGIVRHACIDINEMQVIGGTFDLFFDYLIGIPDAIDDIPSADAWFDRDKCKRNVAELTAGAGYQLLEENEYFLGMAAVAEVIVAGIDDHRLRMEGGDETVEEPIAGGKCRAAKSEVDGFSVCEVLIERFPKADGRAAIKQQLGIVRQFRAFLFQPLNFVLVPDHSRGLDAVNILVRYASARSQLIDKVKLMKSTVASERNGIHEAG